MTSWSVVCRLAAVFLFVIPIFGAHAEPHSDWWVDITNNRASRVEQHLRAGADPNDISPMGQPAIMQAIREGAWDVYDVLLVHPKTAFNAININRETPLMYLAVIGETERALDLINRGALVNRKGWTPLHYAASTGQMDTARMLLDQGALVNAPAPDDTTPLMMAAYGGSEPMVRLLLEAGADVTLRNRQDYDVVDWAGFKSNTVLAEKLQALIDGTKKSLDGSGPLAADATKDQPASAEPSSGTSRYFDLDRFNEPATP